MTDTAASEGSGIDLLMFLHALVMRDRGPSGLRGRVTFGVRTQDEDAWWTATLGATTDARFEDQRPRDVDASIVLADSEAEALLKQGTLPKHAEFSGDKKLFDQFLTRYVAHQTAFDVRSTSQR